MKAVSRLRIEVMRRRGYAPCSSKNHPDMLGVDWEDDEDPRLTQAKHLLLRCHRDLQEREACLMEATMAHDAKRKDTP